MERLIAIVTIADNVETPVFVTYVTQMLAPQLSSGAIVVIDNLKLYYAICVQAAIFCGRRLNLIAPIH
ncbi:hypothetical protein QUB05_29710 [Microcoleus sp. F10-C6]|uniref:hypothetical protein n=1 Tax=unclassified Microcoleus TaxID=2642155 RepID=UPI002FD1B8CF